MARATLNGMQPVVGRDTQKWSLRRRFDSAPLPKITREEK
jgi:hypothetical protein